MELIEKLLEDHKRIKKLIKDGKKKDLEFSYKKSIFKDLALAVTAHAKSEEKVVYIPAKQIEEIKHFAFEGAEEHNLVDQLIQEDIHGAINRDEWEAKFKVICDMLDHHLTEEEKQFFPKLKKAYSTEERKAKGHEYEELFQHIIKYPKEKNLSLDQINNPLHVHH